MIAYKLRQTYLTELEIRTRNILGIIGKFEKNGYEHTVTRLLRAKDCRLFNKGDKCINVCL